MSQGVQGLLKMINNSLSCNRGTPFLRSVLPEPIHSAIKSFTNTTEDKKNTRMLITKKPDFPQ
jgi:hypothetical protein